MARYTCPRCGAQENTLNAPHLCKDVAARLRRFEQQVGAVCDVLYEHTTFAPGGDNLPLASAIVTALNRLGVGHES